MAEGFAVSESDADVVLGDFCDSHLIEKVGKMEYAVTKWPERDQGEDFEVA